MADLKAFAEQLVNLTVKEVNELATILKEEYGIEPAAAAVAAVSYTHLDVYKRQLYMVRTIWSICWKCLLRMECCR